jgi:hypothetical protein
MRNRGAVAHARYALSDRMRAVTDGGMSGEVGPGDAFVPAPGHGARVGGDEACVVPEVAGCADHAGKG